MELPRTTDRVITLTSSIDPRAVRLAERVAYLRERMPGESVPPSPSPSDANAGVSRARDEMLRVGVWHDRLAVLRTTEAEYLHSVSSDDFQLAYAPLADVDSFIARVMAEDVATGTTRNTTAYADFIPPLPEPLALLVERDLADALEHAGLNGWAKWDAARVQTRLIDGFLLSLQGVVAPTVVTELHAASLAGLLIGDTPEERYADFIARFIHDVSWTGSCLQKYPVLARHLAQRIAQWVRNCVELLSRLRDDFDDVVAALLNPVLDVRAPTAMRVVDISSATGDLHRGGQCVRIVTFSDGQKAVYKPRTLAADHAFQTLIEWLNVQRIQPPLRGVAFIDRGTHGWCRFVDSAACADTAAVGRFYARQGAHLAILYILGGYDFFWENVKASGEYPFLIDLECVASPALPGLNGALFDSASRRYFNESVARAGLLPSWSWSNGVDSGINIGALSDVEGQLFPHDTPVWLNPRRDDTRQGRARVEFQVDRSHLPELDGRAVPANSYLEELVGGFQSTYHLLLRHSGELLSPGGPLAEFATAPTRAVIRQTRDYALLLQEMTHPDYTQHAVATDELLENLWRSSCPRYPAAVLQSEIDQLWHGDVPYFETRGTSTTLFDGRNQAVLEHYVDESTLEGIRRRIARLSDADCQLQVEIMLRAFSIVDVPLVGLSDALLSVRADDKEGNALAANPPYELEAVAIADRLLDVAISDEESLTWIGLTMAIDGNWQQASLDDSLYDGGVGVAFFLLYADRITTNHRYRSAVELVIRGGPVHALEVVRANMNRLEDWVTASPSGFELPCSALFLLAHVDALWGTRHLERAWEPAAGWLNVALRRKPRFDLVSGAAGVILQLLGVYRRLGDPEALRLARCYGEILLEQAEWRGAALAWKNEFFVEPLPGMTHGTAGCSLALQYLGHALGDDRFMKASEAAMDFDRQLLLPDGTWRDSRLAETARRQVSWCHGASGFALSKALIYEQTRQTSLLPEIERAVRLTLNSTERSDCLCHGTLGNLDCVQRAAMILNRQDWHDDVQSRLLDLWQRSRREGIWRCGLPDRAVSLPGLFMGLAGIGHGLLRLTHPDIVPSPLALDGPIQHVSRAQAELRTIN
jgi:type 2 lantibiotic biosynthesis protein LanM